MSDMTAVFCPVMALISDDLPLFRLPKMPICSRLALGVLVRLMMLPSFQKRKSRFPAAISARCSAVRRRTFSLGMHGSIWAIIASPLARVSGDA